MKISPIRAAAMLSLVVIAATGSVAFAQQAEGRVVSSTPMRMANGSTAYAVTYDYNGSRYSTRTASPPGATIPLQVDSLGVTTVEAVNGTAYAADDSRGTGAPPAQPSQWQNVVPEPGVVVSGGGGAAPVYPASAPVYVQSAPVYMAPAPVYVAPGYGYGWGGYGYGGYGGYGYGYPPVGVSLNFGYSRGWGGGYYRRGWR